jgi:chemotaxis protein methyltransferase CheR
MNAADFELLSGLIKERSGLVLTPDKLYLLESRLTPVARNHEVAGLNELVSGLRTRTDDTILNEIVEAMTTNESFFFRDSHMFDRFRDEVLPELIASRQATKRLRIWCAAASSGQEPYSIAMILNDMGAALANWKVDIVGTDISPEILERAASGLYTQFEVQRGVPTNLLLTHFERVDDMWRISESIRSMVEYRTFNLLDSPLVLGKFDVVFCRNVLIYFDEPTKRTVLENIAHMMPPDGVLLLGGAETVLGLCESFENSAGQRGIYRLTGKNNAAPGAAAPSVSPGAAVGAPPAAPATAVARTPPSAPATRPPAAPAAAPAARPPAAPAAAPAARPPAAPAAAPTGSPAAPAAAPAVKPPAAPAATPAVKPAAAPAAAGKEATAAPTRPGLGASPARTTAG